MGTSTSRSRTSQTGTQFLFEIGTEVSADGAYPKSKGFNTGAASGTSMQGVTLVATVQETIGGTGTTPNVGSISSLPSARTVASTTATASASASTASVASRARSRRRLSKHVHDTRHVHVQCIVYI